MYYFVHAESVSENADILYITQFPPLLSPLPKEKEKSNSIDFSFFLFDQVIQSSLPYFSVNGPYISEIYGH